MQKETWSWETTRLASSWPRSLAAPSTVRVSRWGYYGTPVLLMPSAGGDFEEVERFGLIAAIQGIVASGRVKVFSVDGIAAHSWIQAKASPDESARAQRAWETLIYEEVVPHIRRDCHSESIEIYTAGFAYGACSAIGLLCHYPDVFRGAIAMSMSFGMPVYWPEGRQLTQLRQRYVQLACGEGSFERPVYSRELAQALTSRGVPHHLDLWGRKYAHGWAAWREMLPKYVVTTIA
ncbi:MAG TPA: alpha/beta hydrolase-fold protein [Steroidobacteraceae bacterium]|nr:alpha/beta hydrolase-fold protein [Steroidobacteraceae bacterium]